jgi:DNA-binding transcriptional regulator YdaS (Cro superfamily)
MTGIEQACYAAGSQAKLADLLGCSQQNISSWLRRGYAPPERVVEIEQATGIPRVLLVSPKLRELLSPPETF